MFGRLRYDGALLLAIPSSVCNQSKARILLNSDHPPFIPSRRFPNGHCQTIGAFLMPGRMPQYKAVKRTVDLPDGDRLVIHDDQPERWITGDRIAIMLHGLCGCHGSPYIRRAAQKLRRLGVRVIRVDMRGFGDSELISRSHLHGGCSPDLQSVVAFVQKLSPLSKISLVGFSLGGNVVLKALGEWGNLVPPEIDSAIAVSPPVDLIHCSWNLRQGGNRIYEKYFMRRLRIRLARRRRLVKDLADSGVTPMPDRLVHYDDQFVAPVFGFNGARDYYETCSAGPVLQHIHVPTIILSAKDDPVVPNEMYDRFPMSAFIDRVTTDHGGHLGFIGTTPKTKSRQNRFSKQPIEKDLDPYWMDWRICQWVTAIDEACYKHAELQERIQKRIRERRYA